MGRSLRAELNHSDEHYINAKKQEYHLVTFKCYKGIEKSATQLKSPFFVVGKLVANPNKVELIIDKDYVISVGSLGKLDDANNSGEITFWARSLTIEGYDTLNAREKKLDGLDELILGAST